MQEELIRPKKLHEQVAERLQAMILGGQYLPGDKLPSERELQATFGIGRPAVREALLLLERAGLVVLRSGSPATIASADPGTIISQMSVAVERFLTDPQGAREIQAARRLLECCLAREAAKHIDEAACSKLGQILERSRESLDDVKAFENLDMEFHNSIMKVAKSQVFDVVFTAMNQWLRNQRSTTLALPGQTDIVLADHTRIYETIAARDLDGAEDAMRAHLENVEKAYWVTQEMTSRRIKARAGYERILSP
jgi:GntR family transcriptional repressor for pyruvate dehydrogenase complex